MLRNKKIIIVYVKRNELLILGGKFAQVENILIPETVVNHMDVVNIDELYKLIKVWTDKHPVQGQEIVWIFGSETYFEYVLEAKTKEQWESMAVTFLDMLPFEEVESRVYVELEQRRVVAVNGRYYKSLKGGFGLQGYLTRLEIPAFVLGEKVLQGGLNKSVLKLVESKLRELEKQRLVEVGNDWLMKNAGGKPKKKSSLPILIGVFGVLVIIMIVMWMGMERV